MDKIWDRNPSKSEVIGRCGGDEKNEWPRRTDKSRVKKTLKKCTFKSKSLILLHSPSRKVPCLCQCYFLTSQILEKKTLQKISNKELDFDKCWIYNAFYSNVHSLKGSIFHESSKALRTFLLSPDKLLLFKWTLA